MLRIPGSLAGPPSHLGRAPNNVGSLYGPAAQTRRYRVQKGDSMARILQRNGLPPSAAQTVLAMNGKRSVLRHGGVDFAPGQLLIGEILTLPASKSSLSGPPNSVGSTIDECYKPWFDGTCGTPGFDWNESVGLCCPNGGIFSGGSCPLGYEKDANGDCVEVLPGQTYGKCGENEYMDANGDCQKIPPCGPNQYYDPNFGCTDIAGTKPPQCPPGWYPEKNQDGLYTGDCFQAQCGQNAHYVPEYDQCYCNAGYQWASDTSNDCVPIPNGGGGDQPQPGGGGGDQPQPGGGGGTQTSGTSSSDGPGIVTYLLGAAVVAAAGFGAYKLAKGKKSGGGG